MKVSYHWLVENSILMMTIDDVYYYNILGEECDPSAIDVACGPFIQVGESLCVDGKFFVVLSVETLFYAKDISQLEIKLVVSDLI